MKYALTLFVAVFFLNCRDQKSEELSAQSIVDRCMEVSGNKSVASSIIAFVFREKRYVANRYKGIFQLERRFTDSLKTVRDVLSNDKFKRFINDFEVEVADTMISKYSASVNSVHYFSALPYGLNDAAVKKTRLGDVSIKNKNYHTIKVTFRPNGGGEDFEDVFLYWIHSETYKLAYLAYSYNESDGKGIRFREAYNERYVEGIRFVDYNNYKPENNAIVLINLPHLLEQGHLKLVSKIELEAISVKLN